jgi:transcriptional regulator NrdR family protein
MTEPRIEPGAASRGLVCPQCGGRRFDVIYTRPAPGEKIMRRRECSNCGRRITTWEVAIGASRATIKSQAS